MTDEAGRGPTLFISYSHKDEEWKDLLVTQLGVLSQQGFLDLWDDRRIVAGDNWQEEIEQAINAASLAVLLISANFLTSKFILEEEIPRLLTRRAKEGVRVIPLMIKHCAWKTVGWLSQMQVRPKDARPLSAGNANQVDIDLAELAGEIYRLLGRDNSSSEAKGFVPLPPQKISISRMPVNSPNLFGRDQELELLDRAWRDAETNIVSIIAWGGVGKSALISYWLRRIEKDQYRGAERVYAWSFYRQGTSEQVISADEFIASALTWFDDADPTKGTAWDKGERLASLIREQRTVLVLDGLESLQFPPGQQEGKLKDNALQALLRELAAYNPGLCLISTRISVADLMDFEGNTVHPLNLEHLSVQAGAQILRSQGVKGEDPELEKIAGNYGGHSLALTLLGSYLNDVYQGDIRNLNPVDNLESDVRYGGHAQRVMAAYEKWFGDGPEAAVLRLLGLFDRPADGQALAALRAAPAIPGLTEALQHLSQTAWRQVLSKLRRAKLLAEAVAGEPDTLDAHPLVREHFGRQLRMESPAAWREGNNRLYEHFKRSARELPDTIQEMQPLFLALVYGCNAGRHTDALHEVYLPRIMRGEQSYAARKLGAHGALLSSLIYFFEDRSWNKPVTPNLPERQGLEPEDQLTVLTHAGLYLTATKGYASNEMLSCYVRIKELCLQLKKASLLYSVLVSEWRYSLVTNNLTTTFQIAKDVYDLANSQHDPALILGAYRTLAGTAYFRGQFELTRKYAKQGVDIWETKLASSVSEFYAPIVTCLLMDAISLWHLGSPDQSWSRVREAVSMARDLSDMNALSIGLFINSHINQFRRMPLDLLASSQELIEVCTVQGFTLWLAAGEVLRGWAVAKGGELEQGYTLMRQGFIHWRATGAGLCVAYFLSLQAEILGEMGQPEKALLLLEEAFSFANKFDEYWCMAELYRLRGEMMLFNKETAAKGESTLDLALGVARSQGAKSLELRVSISLFRLWWKQGKKKEARRLLENIYNAFTEGFETADLKEARALLENTIP
jgi:tetratricopeptide (TPR) repeat protein